MTTMQQLSAAQASPEVPINENFESLEHQAVYGKRHAVTTGLTWGYYGGRWGGNAIADGTVTLTGSATNYLVIDLGTGAVSVSTSSTNWDDTDSYARLYKITAGAASVTAVEDHRAGPYGAFGGAGTGVSTLGELTDVDVETTSDAPEDGDVLTYDAGRAAWIAAPVPTTIGVHSIPVTAAAMAPSATGGCAALSTAESGANQPDIVTLDFDATTAEYAQFSVPMPKKWDEGTITAKFIWSHASTTTNFGVVWALQAVAVGNDDAIGAVFGTAQEVADTGGTTDDLYISGATPAITVGGSPAAEDVVFFRVYRDAADGSDTLAVDARLHAVVLTITTAAQTDA